MYTTKNSLKTFISTLLEPTNITNVSLLQEGELGFFEKDTGDLISDGIGEGFFALMKNSEVLRSDILTFAGYAAALKSYSAPTLKSSTITIPSATVGATYVLNVEIKLVGMSGEFFLTASYTAVTSDSTTDVAAALVANLNAQLVREKKTDYLTVSNASAVITISSKLRSYVQGKLQGRPAEFNSRLTSPVDEALLETVTVVANDGIGYGPYIAEKEYLAQGDSDHHREVDWRNNFEWTGNTLVAGQYDVAVILHANQQKTANARVDAPQEHIIAFNTIGATNAPIIDAAVNGDTTVTGIAFPGSTVVLSVDGSPETGVSAHGTTGVYTVTVTVATDEVLTAVATATGLAPSITSNAVTVTAT